jgi:tRNA(Arg) A34 adenosine deaminase TadA
VDHAELRLVHRWWHENRAPFPEGSTLYVTLEPCRMCAGAISQLAPPGFKVFFRERELGPSARHPYFSSRQIPCTEV